MTDAQRGQGGDPAGGGARHTVSVVVPVYNEADTVERAIERLLSVPFDKEVIVVDDGSEDGTGAILERLRERGWIDLLLKHDANRGKGAALRTAFERMTGSVAVILDADLELDPADIPRLLVPIEEGRAVAVYGTRDLSLRTGLMLRQYLGNKVITLFTNLCTNLRLSDVETCYKMVRTDLLRTLDLVSDRFTIDPEITIRLAQTGVAIHEVPISYRPRSHAEGKKITWMDGVAALWSVLRFTLFGPKPKRWEQTRASERRSRPADTPV
jgi:glycosyltransferase involved in cell wall biosynthesis